MPGDKYVFKNVPVTGQRNERLKKHFSRLADRYGWPSVMNELNLAATEWLASNKRGPGRPLELSKDRIMHVWLAIEIERYRRKKRSVKATTDAIFADIKTYLEGTHGKKIKQWRVYIGGNDEWREFGSSVRRWHEEAKELMAADPKLAAGWQRSLESAKVCLDEGWKIEKVGDRKIRIIKTKRGPKTAPQLGQSK
jgi:hypothetical protein